MGTAFEPITVIRQAKELFKEERKITRLDGWFLAKEITMEYMKNNQNKHPSIQAAEALLEVVKKLPLSISHNAIFAGTQRDAFAKSYALINPNFKVSTFNGYCDPTAVFNDIEPNYEFTIERIQAVREFNQNTPYVKKLSSVYKEAENDTKEVAYFVEQVTGHLISDFRPVLKSGIGPLLAKIRNKLQYTDNPQSKVQYQAMEKALQAPLVLAERYKEIAEEQLKTCTDPNRKVQLETMISALNTVPLNGAGNLYQAIQSYILLWQIMCLEQAPNPFAFSVGNADRIFEPYRAMENLSREESAALFTHFLVFFNVGDRSWAISQNILVGGRDLDGNDLTNPSTFALLDAFYTMNMPQPILSVKLHKNSPDCLYEEIGKFFFTPGCLTPSLFNDDSVFDILTKRGVDKDDLPDYAIAGCQEPLIMGKDNGNTTNSWLNLAKILELTLTGGKSLISGETIDPHLENISDRKVLLENIRELFYKNVETFVDRMVDAANGASEAISYMPVPFLSCFMGGIESGIDVRSTEAQGTKYNGSGCLIHGLSVVADSFIAIDSLLKERPQDCEILVDALRSNFENYQSLREFLLSASKYGNNIESVDKEAAEIARRVSNIISSKKNYLGNPFRPDWSTPSTHLLYGYWVGATPDGRKARDMLNYGTDPLYGEAQNGLGFRILSSLNLPYEKFTGGYASHIGLDPAYFRSKTYEEKGIELKKKVIEPLFFSNVSNKTAPFYLYLNVTTPDILKKVLAEPEKYAPSGIYIVRIHGTFVNFLDLSPEIQQDIIARLDLKSTTC